MLLQQNELALQVTLIVELRNKPEYLCVILDFIHLVLAKELLPLNVILHLIKHAVHIIRRFSAVDGGELLYLFN